MITILFPGGAHGHYLKYLLDYMSTGSIDNHTKNTSNIAYDTMVSESRFFAEHHLSDVQGKCIQVVVPRDMYLPYVVHTFTRTATMKNLNIDSLENLHIDTARKIKLHPVLRHLAVSLFKICKFNNNNTTIPEIREWIRICFFDDSDFCATDSIIESSINVNADYTLSLKDIYGPGLADICADILNTFNIPILNTNIADKVAEFENNIGWSNIAAEVDAITRAIKQKEIYHFTKLNVIKEAYIDYIVSDIYKCEIDFVFPYFTNTKDLLCYYGIQ
jgi:hypothetical protein